MLFTLTQKKLASFYYCLLTLTALVHTVFMQTYTTRWYFYASSRTFLFLLADNIFNINLKEKFGRNEIPVFSIFTFFISGYTG